MLYAGLDLSRTRLDFHLLDVDGATVEVGAAPQDADGLLGLTRRLDRHREPIRAAIESMNGARFVHDQLELAGWQVEIADAQKVKGLAPLACQTDRISDSIGFLNHSGHCADANQLYILLTHKLNYLVITHWTGIGIDQNNLVLWWSKGLQEKHPEVRHEVASDAIIWIVEQDLHLPISGSN